MKLVATEAAPRAVGPYSQAVVEGGLVFTAGQVGLDPVTGKLVEGGVKAETRRALANLRAVLEAAGSGFPHILKTTLFLADIRDFQAVNAIYAEAFGDHRPARSTVQAAALPLGARMEIDAVARLSS